MALDRDLIVQALPAYEVGDEIGRGGCGIVLSGVHRSLRRDVAIKQLPRAFGADPDQRARFVSEARLLASFDHPHIVPIFDYVEYEGVCMLVMERLTGGTVWDRMQQPGGISPQEACAIALATCAGLHYAHQKDTLHRDVKPENLMFSTSGTLKITDFGIAKFMGSMTMAATQAGYVVGTPAYIAPEQAQSGELGPATDVYALGTVLFELLAQQLPYAEVTDQVVFLYQHVHEDPAPLASVAPAIPEPIARAVDAAIQRNPLERHASAEDFGMALAGAATEAWGSSWLEETGVSVMSASRMLRSVSTGRHRATAPPAPSQPQVPSEAPQVPAAPLASAEAAESVKPAEPEVPSRATIISQPAAAPASSPSAAPAPTPPSGERSGGSRRWLLLVGVLLVGLIGAGAAVLLGGDDDGDGDGAISTTTLATSATDGPARGVSAATLAGALALSLDDLPDGFEQRALGGVVDPEANGDPCLATLPAPYVFQAAGDGFGNDEPGLEVSSTVALAADDDSAAANAAAVQGEPFLECVRTAVSSSVNDQVESVVLERTALQNLDSYVTSWMIEARSVGGGAGYVESVVLSHGRAVVTVNFLSSQGRVAEDFRDAVLASVDTRLRATDQ